MLCTVYIKRRLAGSSILKNSSLVGQQHLKIATTQQKKITPHTYWSLGNKIQMWAVGIIYQQLSKRNSNNFQFYWEHYYFAAIILQKEIQIYLNSFIPNADGWRRRVGDLICPGQISTSLLLYSSFTPFILLPPLLPFVPTSADRPLFRREAINHADYFHPPSIYAAGPSPLPDTERKCIARRLTPLSYTWLPLPL